MGISDEDVIRGDYGVFRVRVGKIWGTESLSVIFLLLSLLEMREGGAPRFVSLRRMAAKALDCWLRNAFFFRCLNLVQEIPGLLTSHALPNPTNPELVISDKYEGKKKYRVL